MAAVLACSMSIPAPALAYSQASDANQIPQEEQNPQEEQGLQEEQDLQSESDDSQGSQASGDESPDIETVENGLSIQDTDGQLDTQSADEAESEDCETASYNPDDDVVPVDWTTSYDDDDFEWCIDDTGTLIVRPKDGAESATVYRREGTSMGGEYFWPWYGKKFKYARFEKHIKVITCVDMFSSQDALRSVDFTNLDTSGVKNFKNMFFFCSSMQDIDLTGLDVSSATNLQCMFSCCEGLKEVTTSDFSTFDMSKITNVSGMFYCCTNLESADLTSLDTSSVTTMASMFQDCKNLKTAKLSFTDTSHVTSFADMFYRCLALTSLDISNFDTSSALDMQSMFYMCESLKTLDVSSFDTSKVIDMECMFEDCEALTKLDLKNFKTPALIRTGSIFGGCKSLKTLDISNFDTRNIDYAKYTYGADYFFGSTEDSSLTTIKIGSNFDFRYNTDTRKFAFPVSSETGKSYRWTSSADGKTYTSSNIPIGVAATYTRKVVNRPGTSSYYVTSASSTETKHSHIFQRCNNDYTLLFGKAEAAEHMNNSYHSGALRYVDTEVLHTNRIAGAGRYDTAALISKATYSSQLKGTGAIVLASGENFPDALGASALAGALDAPILLTSSSSLSAQVSSEIYRLDADTVYIVGGTSAVSQAVEDQLKAYGLTVVRVAGSTRQDTAVEVADTVASMASPDTAIVASGSTAWDSLSISPYSYSKKYPVYLTDGDGTLSASTIAAIKANGNIKNIVITGGTSAVSPEAQSALEAEGYSVERWSGSDRYETSQAIADHAIADGMSSLTVGVASGESFADALAGAALIGKNGGVMLLSPKSDGTQVASWIKPKLSIHAVYYLLGGTAALGTDVKSQIDALCTYPHIGSDYDG